ncbi:MAG: tRNA (N6-isopentenyl adenosine(37)-C2)-methylthiotransferase MiaB [Clostridia bacterium]|nr:tRNA (N6-isopentenyl adenosine(37)-C2)-methylthiotransferase MiaB [Clostridia bacterium]MBR2634863.1 tRNA (N6-isopentenyl adenosine(37)-C2)-methylthiotransferase MiaB [Clostridia bacterium]
MKKSVILSKEEISKQYKFMSDVKSITGGNKKVYIQTFGCQQNEADSERLLGMAEQMGYEKTADPKQADLILVNTCAVREHAELKALSITGGFKHCKEANPELIIGVCGCMVSQEHRINDIKKRYPYINFLLGTTLIHRLPETLYETLTQKKRIFRIDSDACVIAEDLPVKREPGKADAWVSVMYGCNNFCSYCIVPYVRGRERSREPEAVLSEIKALIKDGVKVITLLGQNVNSYSPAGRENYGFADLLSDICRLDGEAVISFMTSHPKDATERLIDVIAENPPKKNKVGIARRFHLPLQSGSDRILKAMNRHYDIERYLYLVDYMKKKIPDIAITSDIIVGFPTETEEEFLETLEILKRVRFDNVYSFIYSRRNGTPAAEMDGQIPEDIKGERLRRLLDVQTAIGKEKYLDSVGKTVRALVEDVSKTDGARLTARTETNRLIHFEGDASLIGDYAYFYVEKAEAHELFGRFIKKD